MTSKVEENKAVHILKGSKSSIISAGKRAFDHINKEKYKPLFGVISDCRSRNRMLSDEELEEEVEMIKNFLECPLIGFYGYGEIGGKGEELTTFKNETVSGFVVMEEK